MTGGKYVLMGVAGSGKTSVGEALRERLGWYYLDGDNLHPAHNIEKMKAGLPLTDEDRAPWLDLVGMALGAREGPIAIGCSALKRKYRDTIRQAAEADVCFIHLSGSRTLIRGRMAARQGHFMPVSMLDSQFEALEPPIGENSITADISGDLGNTVAQIENALADHAPL